MTTFRLNITPIAGVTGQPSAQPKTVSINENIALGQVIGVLTNFPATFTSLTWVPSGAGSDSGRYEIVNGLTGPGYSATNWVVRINPNYTGTINYEDDGDFQSNLWFDATAPNGDIMRAQIAIDLRDINDAPINIVHDGGHVIAGQANVIVGHLDAYDEDDHFATVPPTPLQFAVDATGPHADLFTVDASGNLKLQTGKSLTIAGADGVQGGVSYYNVQIKVTDGGGYDNDPVTGTGDQLPATAVSTFETIKVFVDPGATLPTLAIGDATVTEGNGGTASPTAMTFTVTRTGDLTSTSSVNWALAHGTTTAADFTGATNGTVTFAAGASTATITLNVVGDTAFEPSETFTIGLSNATGATITDNSGAGTITNDDAVPTLAIGDATVLEGNGGTASPTAMTFTVTRTGDLTLGVRASTGRWRTARRRRPTSPARRTAR